MRPGWSTHRCFARRSPSLSGSVPSGCPGSAALKWTSRFFEALEAVLVCILLVAETCIFFSSKQFSESPTWTWHCQVVQSSGQKVWLEGIQERLDLVGKRHGGKRACSQTERKDEDVPRRENAST